MDERISLQPAGEWIQVRTLALRRSHSCTRMAPFPEHLTIPPPLECPSRVDGRVLESRNGAKEGREEFGTYPGAISHVARV